MNSSSRNQTTSLVERYALAPAEIEARSLGTVEEAIVRLFPEPKERAVATRIVYAAGDLALAGSIRFRPGAVSAGVTALRRGATIVTDVQMVMAGIVRPLAERLGCRLLCAINSAGVAQKARSSGLPRSVEGMRTLHEDLNGSVVVIGNAPTALLSLLDLVDEETVRPALIIGMPVGFVAAAEAKQELIAREIPYLTIEGTRGGSPLAVAGVNALLKLAAPDDSAEADGRTAILYAGHGSRAKTAAEARVAAIERVRTRGVYPIVEYAFLELASPCLEEGLRRCVEQGATHIAVVPYFLHRGMHVRRDIPALLQREAERYPGVRVSLGQPIGLNADLAEVMIAAGRETARLPDVRELTICDGACLTGGPPKPCCSVWQAL
ncbi:MAG: precorrin-8X methylmutase [Dehalococcoidia bacterium]